MFLTWTRWAALSRANGWVSTVGHRAGDERAHLTPAVAVTLPAAIVPALTALVSTAVHAQAGAGLHGGGYLWRERMRVSLWKKGGTISPSKHAAIYSNVAVEFYTGTCVGPLLPETWTLMIWLYT